MQAQVDLESERDVAVEGLAFLLDLGIRQTGAAGADQRIAAFLKCHRVFFPE